MLTKQQRSQLEAVRRDMLRRFAAKRKRPEEDWIHWVRRVTKEAETAAKHANLQSWVEQHFRKKFRWAGRSSQMDKHRWPQRLCKWRDRAWQLDANQGPLNSYRPRRGRGRPPKRWEDVFVDYAAAKFLGPWQGIDWESQEEDFLSFVL